MSVWTQIVGAVGAGALATLSPCVLPALPIIGASALRAHGHGPVAVAAGLVISFTSIGVVFARVGSELGWDEGSVRSGASVLLIICSLWLLIPQLQRASLMLFEPISRGANSAILRIGSNGLTSQFFLGVLLGAVWSPCIGPLLASALALAGSADGWVRGAAVLFWFGVGSTIPLLLASYASRAWMLRKRGSLTRIQSRAKIGMAIVLLVMGVSILTGIDRRLESWLLDRVGLLESEFQSLFI